jgi:FkbM family methyltransferase
MMPREGDRLLDIGANIGAVSWEFLRYGNIEAAYCYEPDPENLEMLMRNLSQLQVEGQSQGTAYASPKAVVAACEEGEKRSFWKNTGKNKGAHSLVQSRGREEIQVPVVSLTDAFAWARPTLLKVDIEGGEYDFLPYFEYGVPDQIRAIAMELHLTKPGWRDSLAPRMVTAIKAAGFSAVKETRLEGKRWTSLGVWRRD